MKTFNGAKEVYERIEIPEELEQRVEKTLKNPKRADKSHRMSRIGKGLGITAAAGFCIFVVGLNTNHAFAKAMSEIPIFGVVANVLTVRSYETLEDSLRITVKMPEITVSGDGANQEYTDALNQKIQEKIDTYVAEATERLKEYKKAFFETGGTQEEWGDREMEIIVNYEVKYENGPVASVAVTVGEYSVSAYEEHYCYTVDVQKGEELTLYDLLGENYMEIVNESVRLQIAERIKENPDLYYFSSEEGGFSSIDENPAFYLNAQGNPVVVFQRYEIAPGYMGVQEFEILKP